uniref:Uncharacterized protein n=1 Tax=Vitis vinifera TaxID=29760 RepID=A5AH64_VITVI|nr:hypothetical protein VITISV_016497 [Vitis vinifera]
MEGFNKVDKKNTKVGRLRPKRPVGVLSEQEFRNLLAQIENPKSFIIPVFPRLALPSLVPSEHFMLKNLPFYEVSCLVDSEACQAHLKEGQKETLRQAPATGRLSSSFVVCPPTQRNKKYVTRPVQRARTPSLASPSSSSSLSSSSSSNKPEARVGVLVPPIICEEEEMTSNLRVGFRERKRKCLSKSIIVNPSSLKKTCPKPTIDPLSKSILSTIVAVVTSNPNKKPSSIDDISYHKARKPFIVLENISEESFKCLHSSPPRLKATYVPSQQEQITVEIDENSSQYFMTLLPYNTLDTVIACILHMKDYTTFETTKMKQSKTMRAYIAHNMDGNEELLADLEKAKSEVVAAQKLVEAEALDLAEKKEVMAAKKENVEKKVARLRQELQDLHSRFAAQKEDLEANYHKQGDDMFFYGHKYCMKKHRVANGIPSFSSDDNKDEFLACPA